MYTDVIDSHAPNVQQIAEEKTKSNARNVLATLGIVSRPTAREGNDLPEIKLKIPFLFLCRLQWVVGRIVI